MTSYETMPDGGPEFAIETKGLCKTYAASNKQPAHEALKEPHQVEVTADFFALLGPNGAGKSTLIKQISGELKQDSGKIVLGEVEISNHPVFARAKMGLARSFQILMLFLLLMSY